jgi:hypothetical protein
MVMIRNVHRPLLACLILLACFASAARAQSGPRRPRGIYAVVDVESQVTLWEQKDPGITETELAADFASLYSQLLTNQAISGLAIQVHWDRLNPYPQYYDQPYDWSFLQPAFDAIQTNPAFSAKTIQLIIAAGFQSPAWVFNDLNPSCDPLFLGQTADPACGWVTFNGYEEATDNNNNKLPLPWNSTYRNAWQTFLEALYTLYGQNTALVSIAVAGPTAASVEMILPSDTSATPIQPQNGLSPNAMWGMLFTFQLGIPTPPPGQTYDDSPFVTQWTNAIDMFSGVFKSGLTLTVTSGDGLPSFNTNTYIPTNPVFVPDCPLADMDCYTQTEILSYFVGPGAGGVNAKSTQTSGMEAYRAIPNSTDPNDPMHNMGVAAVRNLSAQTADDTSFTTQILGGAQFNTGASTDPVGEGCLSNVPPPPAQQTMQCKTDLANLPTPCNSESCEPVSCIPKECLAPGVTQSTIGSFGIFKKVPLTDLIPAEQAIYNVLYVYFSGTAAASSFGGIPGPNPAPLNYLQIYSEDIVYAGQNTNNKVRIKQIDGTWESVTAQELLNTASRQLKKIAEE